MSLLKSICTLFLILVGVSAIASGGDTYKAVCANCHDKGLANAPRLGDVAKWTPLIAEGQIILTAHGYVGVRAMPPKGGKPDLTLESFSDALNFMVNQSGGNWKTPDATMLQAMQVEIKKIQKSGNH